MQSNVRDKVLFRTPRDMAERISVAGACVRRLKIQFPALVDGLDDRVEAAYTGWPDRFYLIDRGGRITFKSRPGPFGLAPAPVPVNKAFACWSLNISLSISAMMPFVSMTPPLDQHK